MPDGGVRTLRDLLRSFVGDGVRADKLEADFTVGTTAVRIAQPNARRVGLIVTNWGAASVALGFTNGVTATTGWIVGASAWVSFSWFADLDITAQEIWAISAGAGNAVHVIERLLIGD